jgi:hypothetical protein
MTFDPPESSTRTDENEAPSPYAPDVGRREPEPSPLTEWKRVHDALLVQEGVFRRLVARRASGQVALRELEIAHRELQALRELADAVLVKALGLPGKLWSS